MFYCKNCNGEFERAETVFEGHFLDAPPFEKHYVCPFCSSDNILEIEVTHCKYCGAKLKKGKKLYCNSDCKEKGEFLWKKQATERQLVFGSPLFAKVREIDSYNKNYNCNLSYGKYIAMFENKKRSK